MTVKEILARHQQEVEAAMERFLPPCPDEVPTLAKAVRYSVFAGGKRLRPGLVLATCETLGGEAANALPSACAIEMVHTYSLVHDDLPCMDDDDLRRGKPTNHKVFGENMAVLAGDALSNGALWVIARHTPDRMLIPDLVLELTTGAGMEGMIGGQVLDILSEQKVPELDVVRAIHRMKTGALLLSAVRLGAIAARASDAEMERIGTYGRDIGLAFQIIDDVLDEVSDAATLGKTAGKDREAAKMTWPACVGIEASRKKADELVDEAVAAVEPVDRTGELTALARFICSRIH